MRKFQCLLFVLKRSYICHYVIYMTVPLSQTDFKTEDAIVPNQENFENF